MSSPQILWVFKMIIGSYHFPPFLLSQCHVSPHQFITWILGAPSRSVFPSPGSLLYPRPRALQHIKEAFVRGCFYTSIIPLPESFQLAFTAQEVTSVFILVCKAFHNLVPPCWSDLTFHYSLFLTLHNFDIVMFISSLQMLLTVYSSNSAISSLVFFKSHLSNACP